MTPDWPEQRLGDLLEVRHGWPFRGELFSEVLTGRPIVVNIGNFRYEGGFRFESTTVREYRGDFPPEYELRAGDVLVVMTCQTAGGEILGIPARVPADGKTYLHNQRLGKLTLRPGAVLDKDFLYWLFLSPRLNRELYLSASGTKILHTSPSRIEHVRLPIPDLNEQRTIARILRSLDDKIDLNRRMSETLEAMARALFKSWFVDFDPVRAKAEGRNPGLLASVARLFPDRLEESECGEIPAGWTMGAIVDMAEVNPEVWSADTRPNVIHYVDLSSTKWGRIEGIAEFSVRDAPSRAQRVLRPGDTIVGTVRPANGSYAFIGSEGLTGSTGFAVLRPRRRDLAEFVYLAVTAAENIDELGRVADGGAYPAVRPEVVGSSPAIRSGSLVIEAFSAAAQPMLSKIGILESESRTLAALRDTLLPKLISGELRIPDAERIVGEVA
jgi:type I restriction enzyme S subunit